MKVLVVDDSSIIRDRLVDLLSIIQGVEEVAVADNAQNAISTYKIFNPEVLILDIRMHGTNGIDVLKQVKRERNSPKVIMLTNFPYSQYRKKCLEEGADYFLDKSTEFDEINKIISSLVKNPDSLRRQDLSGTDRVSKVENNQNE